MQAQVRRKKSIRKRGKQKRNSGSGKKNRGIQLTVSILILIAAVFGEKLFPTQTEMWKELIFRDIDLGKSIFEFGGAVQRREPLLDALGQLCVDVFCGE